MAHASLDPRESPSLPQYGFGQDFAFASLLEQNPFLFRVHTPKERSPFADDSDPYFVASRYDERYNASPETLPTSCPRNMVPVSQRCSYADVANHMNWTTRSSSPFLSTSFSFVWAIWEALRRYKSNVKHDIEIAIIDASAVANQAVTALELLRKGNPKQ